MKQLTLELTDSDVFSLLQALGKRPYEEVADLIEKIRAQCEVSEEPQEEKTDFSSLGDSLGAAEPCRTRGCHTAS